MSDKRIIEQTGSTEILNDDWFVKDSPTGGATKIQGSKLLELLGGKVDDVQADEISFVDEDKVADITPLAMIGTASGDIASFDEGSGLPFKSVVVNIEPVQDLHGYDNPWVGGSGKNKCDLSAFTHTGVVDDEGGETTLNNRLFSVHIPVKSGTTYTLSLTGSKNGENIYANRIIYFDSNDTFIKRYTPTPQIQTVSFTTLSNAKHIQIDLRTASLLGIEITDISKIQVEEGDSATAYEPYSNICPISGWDDTNVTVVGKNLLGGLPLANAIVNAGGTLDTVNKTVSFTHGNSQVNILENIKLKDNTKYTFILTYSNSGDNNCLSLYYTNSGYRYPINLNNSSDTKTTIVYTTSAITIDKLVLGWGVDANTKIYYEESGLFEGELTTQDFVPYNGHTYNVEFTDGTNPLTVYGGTLDVVSGLLRVNRASVDLGTLSWTYASTQKVFYDNLPTNALNVTNKDGVCEVYKPTIQQTMDMSTWSRLSNGEFVFAQSLKSSYRCAVAIKDLNYTDTAAFKSSVNGMKIVYPLATPQTIQLTPTQVNSLLGINNIWADTGSIKSAEFIKDATTVINSLIASLTDLKTLEYSSYFIGGNTQRDEDDIFCVYNEHLKHVQIDAHPHTVIGSGAVPRGNYVITRVPFIPRYTTYIPINRADSGNINAVLKIRKTEYNNQDIGEISVELLDNNTPKGVELCTHLEFYYDDDSIIPSQSS